MEEHSDYMLNVVPDADRPGRYRWRVVEVGKVRDQSTFSFATRREAQADGERFVEKLLATWRAVEQPTAK
jgi:MOSC domain-containing protein YiiM